MTAVDWRRRESEKGKRNRNRREGSD